MVEKYSQLKTATAAIIRRREEIDERFKKATSELAQTEAELNVAVETSQDDLAVVLIQKKNQLTADLAEMKADLDSAQKDADSAKTSLLSVQGEIRKLKAERDSMLAKMQSAQARIKIQEQIDGLSVDAEVKALDNVREHIKTTIAEANLGREMSESSLDARLAALREPGRRRAGQAATGRAEGQARRAAGGAESEDDVTRSAQAMKLTPFAKLFITVVVLGVLGYVAWTYKGGDIREWAVGRQAPRRPRASSAGHVGRLRRAAQRAARPRPRRRRDGRLDGGARRLRPPVAPARGRHQHLGRATRRASCSTAASMPAPASRYKQKFGLDVKFVLLEDPAAKLAAFRNGDVDIMWNTVDNWAREASMLAEQNQQAKSIIMQDWSRGGDGIVSLSIDQVDRGPEGQARSRARSSRRRTSCCSTCCRSRA